VGELGRAVSRWTLRPVEVDTSHSVELVVERPKEVAQPLNSGAVDDRVRSALRFAETPHHLLAAVGGGPAQARKALGGVEVEVAVVDEARQAEEVLEQGHLAGRVSDQALTVHEVHLTQREATQPAAQVTRVDADLHGAPRRRYLQFNDRIWSLSRAKPGVSPPGCATSRLRPATPMHLALRDHRKEVMRCL